MNRQKDQTKDDAMTMLRRHRLAKGFTLAKLAGKVGVSTAACSQWETGVHTPHPRVIPKLAKVLDIDVMELLTLLHPMANGAGSAA